MSSIVDDMLNEKIRSNKQKKSNGAYPSSVNNKLSTVNELINNSNSISYKFNEDMYVEELMETINSTYAGHYSRDQFQATEFIVDGGHGTGFCIGNIMKYAQRYGKKGSVDDARKDILKVLHYAIIQLFVHDIKEYDKLADYDTKKPLNNEEDYRYTTD